MSYDAGRAAVSQEKVDASAAAETFGGTNGGAAPGTKIASLNAATGKYLVPVGVRVSITGTALTNAFATVRFVTKAAANRDSAESLATGATARIINLRPGGPAAAGTIMGAPSFQTAEAVQGLAQLLTDADQIDKIEVYARRDNTTDPIVWDAEIVALEVG